MVIKPYVFENLKTYGNSVISKKIYKKYGEKLLLQELKNKGYDCTIEVVAHKEKDLFESISHTKDVWESVIVRVKG